MSTIRCLGPVTSRFYQQCFKCLPVIRTQWKSITYHTASAGEKIQTVQEVKEKLVNIMGIERGYNPIMKPRDHLLGKLPKAQDELPVRKMQDSFDSAVIPLSTNNELQEKYITSLGFIRFGRLMEDMDMFAGYIVARYCYYPGIEPLPVCIVTVTVDQIDIILAKSKPNTDIRLSGHVCWVGKSSIEVVVWLEQENHGSWQKITRALFLMAARNATNTGSAIVNPLEPENEKEKEIIGGGEARKKRRTAAMSKSLLKTIPDESEQRLIHDMFIRTMDPRDPTLIQKVLPPHSIWMENAQLHNHIFSHPEDRNLHNKVFGGFLMRHALELAWCAGYLHSKHRPSLQHISDIGFHRPVDVGSILEMHSHVCYTENNYMQIVVYAIVNDIYSGTQSTTNMFHYTFKSPEPVIKVVPKTYTEAMMYVDGRRHFQHVMGLTPDSTRYKSANIY